MPTPIVGLVGQPQQTLSDGDPCQPRFGRQGGDLLVSEFRGKYGQACSTGRVFHFSTLVAGVTLPIFSATAQTYGLRNPASSGVDLEFIRLEIGYLSGTQAPGDLVFCQAPNSSDVIATGSGGVTAATQAAGQTGFYGGARTGPSKCSTLTAITSVAPTVILRTLGLSTYTMPATNATQGITYTGYVFDGTDILAPGQIILLASTVAAGAGVNVINVIAMEVPHAPGS